MHYDELDPDLAVEFITSEGLPPFEENFRRMSACARQHLARLEASRFSCDIDGLSVTAHTLAGLLSQFGFAALAKRVTIYEFAPHYLKRSACKELSARLEAGIGELQMLIDNFRAGQANQRSPESLMAIG